MQRARRTAILMFASGFGAGYVPYCPGTIGTLIAIPASVIVNRLAVRDPLWGIASLAVLTGSAIWVAGQAARILRQKDPPIVTIDEIAGFSFANFLAPSLAGSIIAFVLFRFFDIAKVFPAKKLEALPGGAGIVLDDILAGFYSFLILRLLLAAALI